MALGYLSDCPHASFECSRTSTNLIKHSCNDCSFVWLNTVDWFKHCDICKPPVKTVSYVTKDSGKRESYDSGMVRDTQDGKARPDLLFPIGIPYSDQFIIRVANLLQRGAEKYSEHNWESAEGQAELDRFKSSAFRHFLQWFCGETDEDHMAAVVFNLMGVHLVEWKMKQSVQRAKNPKG